MLLPPTLSDRPISMLLPGGAPQMSWLRQPLTKQLLVCCPLSSSTQARLKRPRITTGIVGGLGAECCEDVEAHRRRFGEEALSRAAVRSDKFAYDFQDRDLDRCGARACDSFLFPSVNDDARSLSQAIRAGEDWTASDEGGRIFQAFSCM